MKFLVLGHLPPPVTGENLCRKQLVAVLRGLDAEVLDVSRRQLTEVLREYNSLILINGQSILGTICDVVATALALLRGRRVYWYFHNQSWCRFSRIPAWLWPNGRRRLRAVVLRESIKNSFQRSGYTTIVLNNCPEPMFEEHVRLRPPATPVQRLIWMGRPTPEKGFPRALEIFEHLYRLDYHWQFDVYGASLEQARSEGWMRSGVTFHGFISGMRKVEAFDAGGVFILPSEYKNETQPLSIIEGLARGVPFVASNIGGIPSMVGDSGHGPSGICIDVSQAVSVWAAAVERVFRNYRAFSQAAEDTYEGSYSRSTYATKVADLFLK